MGRIYVASDSIAAFAGGGDIVEIEAPADGIVKLHDFSIHQSSTETDDSAAIELIRATTGGTGGGAITARPLEVGDAAFGGLVDEANSTAAAGTVTVLYRWGWSALAGLDKVWTPETRPVISPSGRLVLRMVGAITGVTLDWSATFEEIGG